MEDDKNIRDFLAAYLTSNGYQTTLADGGRKAISMTADIDFDVILLDLGLPDLDGLKVIKSLREWSDVPIIVLSARVEEFGKVEALDAGANDYIEKPFGNSELLARIRVAIRIHRKVTEAKSNTAHIFSAGALAIDYDRRNVTKNGEPVHLTPIEYKIVVLLAREAGKVLTHDVILRRVWGEGEVSTADSQILRVNMKNIRRKLEDHPADPRYILTEIGVGYRMIAPEDAPL